MFCVIICALHLISSGGRAEEGWWGQICSPGHGAACVHWGDGTHTRSLSAHGSCHGGGQEVPYPRMCSREPLASWLKTHLFVLQTEQLHSRYTCNVFSGPPRGLPCITVFVSSVGAWWTWPIHGSSLPEWIPGWVRQGARWSPRKG